MEKFDYEEFISSCLRRGKELEGCPEELDASLMLVLEAIAEPFEEEMVDPDDGGDDGGLYE